MLVRAIHPSGILLYGNTSKKCLITNRFLLTGMSPHHTIRQEAFHVLETGRISLPHHPLLLYMLYFSLCSIAVQIQFYKSIVEINTHTYTTMVSTLSRSSPQPISLMDLPRELRDMVYTNVFSFVSPTSKSATRQYKLDCDADCSAIIHLSTISFDWLDLMRTNGLIADEMRQIYRLPAYHNSTTDQTWSAQLTLKNDEYTLAWMSLPCPSSCVRHLSIDFKINLTLSMFGHWDNDSKDKPGNIFKALSELLHQVACHGPNITVSETLRQPIVFETISLNISFTDEDRPYLMSSGPESVYILAYGKRRIYSHLIGNIVTACGNHVLDDKVRHISIQAPKSLGSQKTDITIARVEETNQK